MPVGPTLKFSPKSNLAPRLVTFRTLNDEMDREFIEGAKCKGLVNLKGHRLTGGIRASIYNSMPLEGVELLRDYMKEFECKAGI